MSNEMTAEEYLKQSKECNDSLSVFQTSVMVHYGDLRAKEAVKEFAEELIRVFNEPHYVPFSAAAVIKPLAKQKGVEI